MQSSSLHRNSVSPKGAKRAKILFHYTCADTGVRTYDPAKQTPKWYSEWLLRPLHHESR